MARGGGWSSPVTLACLAGALMLALGCGAQPGAPSGRAIDTSAWGPLSAHIEEPDVVVLTQGKRRGSIRVDGALRSAIVPLTTDGREQAACVWGAGTGSHHDEDLFVLRLGPAGVETLARAEILALLPRPGRSDPTWALDVRVFDVNGDGRNELVFFRSHPTGIEEADLFKEPRRSVEVLASDGGVFREAPKLAEEILMLTKASALSPASPDGRAIAEAVGSSAIQLLERRSLDATTRDPLNRFGVGAEVVYLVTARDDANKERGARVLLAAVRSYSKRPRVLAIAELDNKDASNSEGPCFNPRGVIGIEAEDGGAARIEVRWRGPEPGIHILHQARWRGGELTVGPFQAVKRPCPVIDDFP